MKYLKLFYIAALGVFITAQNGISQETATVEPTVEQSKSDVSSEELKVFAGIYQKVQLKNKEAQQKMAKTVQDEGITIKRYQKLAKAEKNPNSEIEASEEEKEKLSAIKESFAEIQTEFKTKITGLIKEEGMSIQRYQEVYQMVRKDKSLQEELGELMQG